MQRAREGLSKLPTGNVFRSTEYLDRTRMPLSNNVWLAPFFLVMVIIIFSSCGVQGLPGLMTGLRSYDDEEGVYVDEYIMNNLESDNNRYVGLDETIPETLTFVLDPDNSRTDMRGKKYWFDNGYSAGNCRDLITPSNLVIQEYELYIPYDYRWENGKEMPPPRVKNTWTIPVLTENNSYIRTEAKCQGCSPSRHPASPFFLVSGNEIILHGQCDYCKLNSCPTTCRQGEVILASSAR